MFLALYPISILQSFLPRVHRLHAYVFISPIILSTPTCYPTYSVPLLPHSERSETPPPRSSCSTSRFPRGAARSDPHTSAYPRPTSSFFPHYSSSWINTISPRST